MKETPHSQFSAAPNYARSRHPARDRTAECTSRAAIRIVAPALATLLVAPLALAPLPASAAPTACSRDVSGSAVTVTCSGDQSAGIGNADLVNSLPPGAAPPAPAFPSDPRSIRVNVRELDRDFSGPVAEGSAAVIDFLLGDLGPPPPGIGPVAPPPPPVPFPELLTLDVDLDERRVDASRPVLSLVLPVRFTPGFTGVDNAGTAVAVLWQGDLRATTRLAPISVQNSQTRRDATADGSVDVTIEAGSSLEAPLDRNALVSVEGAGDETRVTLQARTALRGVPVPPDLPPLPEPTFPAPGTAPVPSPAGVYALGSDGDVVVELAGGTAAGPGGERIPNIQVDVPGAIGIFAVGDFALAPLFFRPPPPAPPPLGPTSDRTVAVRTAPGSFVLTTQSASPGIVARSLDRRSVEVTVGGEVETRGGRAEDPDSIPVPSSFSPGLRDSVGVFAESRSGQIEITVANTGAIRTRGMGADAIRAQTESGEVVVTAEGTVRAEGAGAAAVRAVAAPGQGRLELRVRRGGSVEGDTAVSFSGGSDNPLNPNLIVVAAGGSLTGSLALGAGAELFDISGGTVSLRGFSEFGAGFDNLRVRSGGTLEPGGPGRIQTVRVAGLEFADFEAGSRLVLDFDGVAGEIDRLEFTGSPTAPAVTGVALDGAEVQLRVQRRSFRAREQRHVVIAAGGIAVESDPTVTLRAPRSFPDQVIRNRYTLVPARDGTTVDELLDTPLDELLRQIEPVLSSLLPGVFTIDFDSLARPNGGVSLVDENAGRVFLRAQGNQLQITIPLTNQLVLVQRTEGSFVLPGAHRNVRAVGAELDRLANRVDPGELPAELETLLSELGALTFAPYMEATHQLHAEPYDALLQGSWQGERALVDALWEGCAPGEAGDTCAFGALFGRSFDREARRRDQHSGFEETAVGPRGGVSRRLGSLLGRSWELRVGAAYEDLDLDWESGARGEGDRVVGGVALHSRGGSGPAGFGLEGLDAGIALAGGGAWFEIARVVGLAGVSRADAEPELSFLGGHGRVVHRFGTGRREPGWYAELGLEGSAVALWLDGFTEAAGRAGALRLRVAETRELVTSVRSALALGGSWQWGELRAAPRARLGLDYAVGGEDASFRAGFVAAPGDGGGGFTTWGDRERLMIEAGGGLDLSLGERLSLEVGYAGRVSPDGTTRIHEGQLRAEWRF